MRPLLTAVLVLAPIAAHAASPEDDYFAARDKYAKSFDNIETWDDSVDAKHTAALKDLETQLRTIVGPFSESGFSGEGTINLDTLASSDVGYGLLDGLAYSSSDETTRVVVTSDAVFTHWLKDHANWWDGMANPPQDIDGALQSETFYAQAIMPDAAVTKYATLPITKPTGAKFAFAMLAGASQDIVPMVPDQVIVSVETEHRVFIVTAPAGEAVAAIPACDQIWQDSQNKADEAYTAYTNSNPQDEALFDAYTKIQEDGAAAFDRCYNERAPKEAYFPGVVKQAQAIADALPKQ
jgi:hypothetical protein